MYEALSDIKAIAESTSPAEFAAQIGGPVFVVYPHTNEDSEEATANFQTLYLEANKSKTDTVQVARLRKREDANSFADMITIGRARNNDLIVKNQSVSKFHAYVRTGTNGVLTLTDAGSSYGTTVNGQKLEARVSQELNPRDEVVLGETVRMVFLTPEALREFARTSRTP